MVDCIQAQITQDLINAIASVTPANGYNTTVACVERMRTILEINDRYPYALVIENAGDVTEEFSSGAEEDLHYLVWYFAPINDAVNPDPLVSNVNTEFAYVNRNVAADIIKAIKKDVSRGGMAQYTKCTSWDYGIYIDNGEALPGVYLLIDVQTRVDQNDPYNLA